MLSGPNYTIADDDLYRYERILSSYAVATEGLADVMADAARYVRRTVPCSDERDSVLRSIAAGVIAPLQVAYVSWVLRRVGELGLTKLYFLARDGQVLLSIAEKLATTYAVKCELHYLFASRQTFDRAVFSGNSYGGWLWTNVNEATTIEELLDRIGLTPDLIADQLTHSGLGKDKWSRPLAGDYRTVIMDVLRQEIVRRLVRDICREKRQMLLRYLTQEKLLERSNFGCVDVGWNGTVHSALSTLVNDSTGGTIHGFHFGLTRGNRTWDKSREAYFFDLNRNTGYTNLTSRRWGPGDRMMVLIETFCAADHGSVSDFVEGNGSVQPVLRQGWRQVITDWGLPVIRRSIDAFAEFFRDRLRGSDANKTADVRPAIAGVLTEFWTNPSAAEAAVWGGFPLEAGQGQETHLSRLAAPYTWSHPFRVVLPGVASPKMDHHWRAGSLRLSSPLNRCFMRLSFGLHDRLKGRPKE